MQIYEVITGCEERDRDFMRTKYFSSYRKVKRYLRDLYPDVEDFTENIDIQISTIEVE